VQSLAEGQTVTDIISIQSIDGTTGDLLLNVLGTNDAPVIQSSTVTSISPSASEDLTSSYDVSKNNETDVNLTPKSGHSADSITVEGNFVFKDVDLLDTHTIFKATIDEINNGVTIKASDLPPGTINFGGNLKSDDYKALIEHATLTLYSANDSTNHETANVLDSLNHTGDVSWRFTIDPQYLDFLADGQKLTLDFTLPVVDSKGEITTENINITINGTNDAPTIVSGPGSDDHNNDGNNPDPDDERILITDPGNNFGGPNNYPDEDSDPKNDNYKITSTPEGETVDINLREDDNDYALKSSSSVDGGTVVFSTIPDSIKDDQLASTDHTKDVSVVGWFNFKDLDLADTHTIAGKTVSEITASPVSIAPSEWTTTANQDFNNEIQEIIDHATLKLTTATDSTGNVDHVGKVNWSFDVDPTYFDFLSEGEVITLSYDIRVDETMTGASSVPKTFNNRSPVVPSID